MLPHSARERRDAPRTSIDLAIEVESHGATSSGRTLDLSGEGLAVLLPRGSAVHAGSLLSFVLVLQHLVPQTPLELAGTAVVVRVADTPDGAVVAFRTKWLITTPLEGAFRAFTPALLHEDI